MPQWIKNMLQWVKNDIQLTVTIMFFLTIFTLGGASAYFGSIVLVNTSQKIVDVKPRFINEVDMTKVFIEGKPYFFKGNLEKSSTVKYTEMQVSKRIDRDEQEKHISFFTDICLEKECLSVEGEAMVSDIEITPIEVTKIEAFESGLSKYILYTNIGKFMTKSFLHGEPLMIGDISLIKKTTAQRDNEGADYNNSPSLLLKGSSNGHYLVKKID